MKPRHAAALALAGWYLIAPPPRTVDDVSDPRAPLEHWQIIGSFDTLGDCQKYLAGEQLENMREFYAYHPEISGSEQRRDEAAMKSVMRHAQCIATDDPRLKGK